MKQRNKTVAEEALVAEVFSAIGYRCEPFSKAEKGEGKTPDFKVHDRHGLVMYCEVKSCLDSDFYERLCQTKEGSVIECKNAKHEAYRLVSISKAAAKQFMAVNQQHSLPNILALVNHDEMFIHREDIVELIRGYAEFINGRKSHTIPSSARKQFAPYRDVIDAYMVLPQITGPSTDTPMLYAVDNIDQFPGLVGFACRYKEWYASLKHGR